MNRKLIYAHNILLFSLHCFPSSCNYVNDGVLIILLFINSHFYYLSLAYFIIMNTKLERTLEFFSQHVLNLQGMLLNNFGFVNHGYNDQYSLMFLIPLQTYLN